MSELTTEQKLEALRERLAAIEHERWSDWQRWVHQSCGPDPTHSGQGALLIFPENVARWERQIATPYDDLSESEKESDRQQVDRYWPLIEQYIADLIAPDRQRIAELERQLAEVTARESKIEHFLATYAVWNRINLTGPWSSPEWYAAVEAKVAAWNDLEPHLEPLPAPAATEGGEAE